MHTRKLAILGFTFSLIGCSGNATDQCMESAYKDYEVTKDEHRTDPAFERMQVKLEAQGEYGRAARECQIRYGDPSNVDRAIEMAEKLRDDDEW
jgi:hypothetical protein